MAHHRRGGPKSTRSGCLMCKPHKHQAESRLTRQELKAQLDQIEQVADVQNPEFFDEDGAPVLPPWSLALHPTQKETDVP